jgi:hypothetical protein
MSLRAESSARPASTTATASLARVRRGSLAALVLLVVQYGIGMYVNLYVTVPRGDHDGGLGSAIANGPAMLSSHAVLGLLLGLVAIGVLVQAVMARHRARSSRRRWGCSRWPLPQRPEPASPAAATPLTRWEWRS